MKNLRGGVTISVFFILLSSFLTTSVYSFKYDELDPAGSVKTLKKALVFKDRVLAIGLDEAIVKGGLSKVHDLCSRVIILWTKMIEDCFASGRFDELKNRIHQMDDLYSQCAKADLYNKDEIERYKNNLKEYLDLVNEI